MGEWAGSTETGNGAGEHRNGKASKEERNGRVGWLHRNREWSRAAEKRGTRECRTEMGEWGGSTEIGNAAKPAPKKQLDLAAG